MPENAGGGAGIMKLYIQAKDLQLIEGLSRGYAVTKRKEMLNQLGKKSISIYEYSNLTDKDPIEIFIALNGSAPPEDLVNYWTTID